jgi:hypothetical protein
MILAKIIGLASTAWLIVGTGWVQIEPTDVALVQWANEGFLTSAFQIVEFIPTIAIMAGWMYLLNKVFSFVPKSGS